MPKHIYKSHKEDCDEKCRSNETGQDCILEVLAVCRVCGGGEGELTTDCCGYNLSYEKREQCYQGGLDYSDEKGWHQRGESHLPI